MTAASATPPTDPSGQGVGRDSLVRSEEQLHVGTGQMIAGYARLEKFTVTETQTFTVELTHEEVRLVQTAASAERQGPAGPTASADGARWMTLRREEVVVTKRIVPTERVRLEVYPVTEQRKVTEQVRKEQIDTAPDTAWASEHDSSART